MELRFAGDPLPTMLSMDTDGHVVYASSFSKTVCPGIRVGYLAGPGRPDRRDAQDRHRHLHLPQHGGPVDRGGVLPLGSDRPLHRDREGRAARAPRRALRRAGARAARRPLRGARGRLLPVGGPARRHRRGAPGRDRRRARRGVREGHRLPARGRARARSASPTRACGPTRSTTPCPAWPAPTASWPGRPRRERGAGARPRPPSRRRRAAPATPCGSCSRIRCAFLALSAAIVVPVHLIVSGVGLEYLTAPYREGSRTVELAITTAVSFLLIAPLVTAATIHALQSVADGRAAEPRRLDRHRAGGLHAAAAGRPALRGRHPRRACR